MVNNSNEYWDTVSKIANRSIKKGHRTVILVDQIKSMSNLLEALKRQNEALCDPVIITGLTKDNFEKIKEFNKGNTPLLIGSNTIGEGVNLKPVDTLILAMPDKSKPAFMQRVGRGLRNYPEKTTCEIYFLYINNPIFKNQTRQRIEYCKEYGKYGKVELEKLE